MILLLLLLLALLLIIMLMYLLIWRQLLFVTLLYMYSSVVIVTRVVFIVYDCVGVVVGGCMDRVVVYDRGDVYAYDVNDVICVVTCLMMYVLP